MITTAYIKAGGGASRSTAKLMKTNQTTSFVTGDDGDIEAGRSVDFFTLAENNEFGNNNRFTDELGSQTFTNDIVIDWSTYDGATVLGWYRDDNGADINWPNSIAAALAFNIGTFTTGWRLPNIQELFSLANWDSVNTFNYAPINLGASSFALWSSTTRIGGTTQAHRFFNAQTTAISSGAKTTTVSHRYIPCRVFTVTGTILT